MKVADRKTLIFQPLRQSFFASIGVIAILAASPCALAHKGEAHSSKKEEHHPPAELEQITRSINESYIASVKPIFIKSCFDCHSSSTKYPWYSNLPVAKGLISKDVTEAKEHLDMSKDFPFTGHGTLIGDLKAIRESVTSDTMPPFRYRAIHWGTGLNAQERETIFLWVNQSLLEIESK